jgi:GNAT superfamily N-acetyltransferase
MKGNVTIRNARPEDDIRCGGIIAAAWMASEVPGRLPHALEMFDDGAPLPAKGRHRLVAEMPEVPDSPAFIAGFTDFDTKRRHVWYLFVEPDLQGAGIGSALLHRAQRIIGGAMTLQCLADARRSLSWYRARGFQQTGSFRAPLCGREVAWIRLRRTPD